MIPAKFQNPDGTPNVGNLAQSLQALGGNPTQFMRQDGSFDANQMGVAYGVLEANKSTPKPEIAVAPAAAPASTNPAGGINTSEPAAPDAVDWNAVTSEIATTGNVSPATRQGLANAGIPSTVLDQHVAGIKAQAEVNLRRVADTIGGMQKYDAFVQWVNGNLPVESRKNLAIAMNQPGGEYAIQGAYAQYEKAVSDGSWQTGSTEPTDIVNIGGGGVNGVQVAAFQSRRERHAAYSDPRYGTDPAYTQEVYQRQRFTDAAVRGAGTPSF